MGTHRIRIGPGLRLLVLSLSLVCGCGEQQADRAFAEHGSREVEHLYETRQSGSMVEGTGVVWRLLPDDREGSRHQRFLIRLDSGQTLLVSHNIDLAERLDGLRVGAEVEFRGQYEWNDRGGLVHWTHHDPLGKRPGGWLRHEGRTYR